MSKQEANPKQLDTRSYIGWYLQGNQNPLHKVFEFKGNLPDAIDRFKKHCERMGIKFIRVRPFLVNLDKQEEYKFQSPEWNDEQEMVGVN
jgi:hypothetical protein